ncbi:nitroreductase family deazaflavin-dependent oxidoreductase [Rhodococcus sp. DMU2021]|uniref:nitroreductase family deazaflavin-dependent oxidoreductase n=1 Tax=Rhodococcus TaxID=1827 RepID=UPI000BA1E9C4|nr:MULTISPECIES: nitroreductase family deazaflavin-dependent oxidoreductase [Rhodococcus]MBX4169543.1 nitroreductase family deazaflavin-dependent oxidoreductase [Rhodococcus sp. DMU2021]
MGTEAAPKGLDSKATISIIKWMSRFNVAAYRATGGRIGGKWRVGSAFPWGIPVCLVTTIGRKTGQPRTVPLLFLEDGDKVVLVASQGGLPKHPLWFRNIQANPETTVQIKSRIRTMRARVASDVERAAYWPRLTAMYPDFDNYQSWTDRVIPVVVCE